MALLIRCSGQESCLRFCFELDAVTLAAHTDYEPGSEVRDHVARILSLHSTVSPPALDCALTLSRYTYSPLVK